MLIVVFTVALAVPFVTAQEIWDLRLVDGDAPYEGRLEIYVIGSGWGTICTGDSYYRDERVVFGLLDADAACRQLGYARAAEVGSVRDLGVPPGQGNTLLGDVKCPPDAKHLYNDCTHSPSCSFHPNTDVAVSCRDINSTPKPYDMRLVDVQNNTNVSAGRLEMYLSGSWATFCSVNAYALPTACWKTARGSYHRYGTVEKLGYLPGSGDSYNMSCDGLYVEPEDCSRVQAPECSHQDDVALSCVACDRADMCDGNADCDLCVDECHCNNYYDYRVVYKRTTDIFCNDCVCDEMEFKCEDSGLCVHEHYVCDGSAHCSDASDENTPECLKRIQEAGRELDELGGRRAGIAVGVVFGVILLLLVPLFLCLCLPPCPLRKIGKTQVPTANVGTSPPSDQPH